MPVTRNGDDEGSVALGMRGSLPLHLNVILRAMRTRAPLAFVSRQWMRGWRRQLRKLLSHRQTRTEEPPTNIRIWGIAFYGMILLLARRHVHVFYASIVLVYQYHH